MNEDVARIIGWTSETDVGEDGCDETGWWHDSIHRWVSAPFYTADELAAWLNKRCGPHDWHLGNNHLGWYGFAVFESDTKAMSSTWRHETDASTILGCLEQLVLQIGAS